MHVLIVMILLVIDVIIQIVYLQTIQEFSVDKDNNYALVIINVPLPDVNKMILLLILLMRNV